MTKENIFEQIADDITGTVQCPQCNCILNIDDLEIIDGFVYCKKCEYLIRRGD